MNNSELKNIAENLIETTELAGNKSMELYKKGLKKIIKPDNSPVTNGDLEVNKILTKKIKELTPSIPIISEETVDLKKKKVSGFSKTLNMCHEADKTLKTTKTSADVILSSIVITLFD